MRRGALPRQPQATPAAAAAAATQRAAAHMMEDGAANPGSVQQVGPCQRCAIDDGLARGQQPPERHLQKQTRARGGKRLGHGAGNACTGLHEFRISCRPQANERQCAFPLQPGSSRFPCPLWPTLLGKLFRSTVSHHAHRRLPALRRPGQGAPPKHGGLSVPAVPVQAGSAAERRAWHAGERCSAADETRRVVHAAGRRRRR